MELHDTGALGNTVLLCFERLRSVCEVERFELVCKRHCYNLWAILYKGR